MSLKNLAKTALNTYALSKRRPHGVAHHGPLKRPGTYRPGLRRPSPKAAAAGAAVSGISRFLRRH